MIQAAQKLYLQDFKVALVLRFFELGKDGSKKGRQIHFSSVDKRIRCELTQARVDSRQQQVP